ncbi:response regulator [Dictyobacter arantiisoli]|uniref:DNA-binding response regulator n=1 Tax=Dictyobacter arantiisoli TaxID=2014874 RepID=A0A5A5TB73_9CHLR|nr:response regulator transcription factor [Dictyobacter arantiisoli]GCF08249.1 DNA-binding response regulator [Dictyobacter arantiisoli]
MVHVLVVDDHSLMRRVVREVIEKEIDMEVVAEASNGQEAELHAAQTQPDVVLMDVDMPDCTGFEATERVLACSPNSRVIIFTSTHHEQLLFQAIQKGAMGYITKDIEPDALIHAIRCAARNDLCIPGIFATHVLNYLRSYWRQGTPYGGMLSGGISYRTPRRTAHVLPGEEALLADPNAHLPRPLTERENQILDLMRKGRKNREIALELSIAESTVHKHVQNIFEKLHARNRTEAIYLTSIEA